MPNFSKMSDADQQRMFNNFRRDLANRLRLSGVNEDEIDLYFSAGNDPVKMALAITAIQIAKEERTGSANIADVEGESMF